MKGINSKFATAVLLVGAVVCSFAQDSKLSSDLLHAVAKGDAKKIRDLATEGADIKAAGPAVLDVEALEPVTGGFKFKLKTTDLVRPSLAMLTAVQTDQASSVETLLDLGVDTQAEFYVDADLGKNVDTQAVALAVARARSAKFENGAVTVTDGYVISSTSPTSAKTSTYLEVAQGLLLKTDDKRKQSRLQEVVDLLVSTKRSKLNAAFVNAAAGGDVKSMKALATRGADVNGTASAGTFDIEDVQQTSEGFRYKIARSSAVGAYFEPMAAAAIAGRVAVVQALLDLGTHVNGEYTVRGGDLNFSAPGMDPNYIAQNAELGQAMTIRWPQGYFILDGFGYATSTVRPTATVKGTYLELAEKSLAKGDDKDMRQRLQQIVDLLRKASDSAVEENSK